ncbi:amino acid adenylation domain-containing protein [Fulvivirga sp.]|uniref:non-ribosomal peptide synthetase n=1 Tax=Fulvivirga sp. TaxID=1931237 RepID=UPI0032EF9A39
MNDFLIKLKQKNIRINVVDDNLSLDIPEDLEVQDILAEVKEKKQDLISFLKNINTENEFEPITPCAQQDSYVLSSAQKRLYFLFELDKKSIIYNVVQTAQIKGDVDISYLKKSFEILVSRHESLRTTFRIINGEPRQIISDSINLEIETFTASESEIDDVINSFVRPFDLNNGPLIRVGLIKVEEARYILIVDMHHIIADGTSQGILIDEFNAIYKQEKLSPMQAIHYKDYAEWQQSENRRNELKRQKEYWINEFNEPVTVLELPTDYPRPFIKKIEGDQLAVSLGHKTTSALKSLAREEQVTMFMILLSVFNILLSKLTNKEDIIVGTPVAGRDHADLNGMVGMFVNTLPIRNKVRSEMTFKEFLGGIKTKVLSCFANQEYEFEGLIEEVKIERDMSRNPLFDVMFAYQNFERSVMEIPDLEIDRYRSKYTTSKFDLTLIINQSDDDIFLNYEFATSLFKRDTVYRISSYLQHIIDQVIANPDKRISEIALMTEHEQTSWLKKCNDTSIEIPETTLVELFKESVSKRPNALALKDQGQELTYHELDLFSDSIAAALKGYGVKVNDVVGIYCSPSVELVASMIGVLKCGAAFMLIDQTNPKDRIETMVKDSSCNVLITNRSVNMPQFPEHVVNINEVPTKSGSPIDYAKSDNSDPCYIMYTSGSTGKPKGAIIRQESLINLCMWHNLQFEVSHYDRAAKYASVGFDATIWEIFPYIIAGASIHFIPEELKLDVKKLNVFLKSNEISICFLPTPVCEQFQMEDNNSLRVLLTGGDKLSFVKDKPYLIVNNYGPTENTVVATSHTITKGENKNIPIGRPIFNTEVYILNKDGQLLPPNVPGELCIGGVGLANGYLNNEAQTALSFVDNPYRSGEKLYRSGDMACWSPNGDLKFLGRLDDQVQVRGRRIELGEIESFLSSFEGVRNSCVDLRTIFGNEYLVGYYVSDHHLEKNEIKDHLMQSVPEYMVPHYFVQVKDTPLTHNGKVNKAVLPDPEVQLNDFRKPKNQVEKQLVQMWAEVIGVHQSTISTTSDFFEIGGHSLKAAALATKLSTHFDTQIELLDIFRFPVLEDFSNHVLAANNTKIEEFDHIKKISNGLSDDNLFFVHDGSGDIQGYLSLSKRLKNFHCWGLKYTDSNAYGPQAVDFKKMANEYIRNIQKVQNEGPYTLIGWSLGGALSFEIARQLEELNEQVKAVIMIDSSFNSPATVTKTEEFTKYKERKFIYEHLNIDLADMEVSSIDELWRQAVINLNEPNLSSSKLKDAIPNEYKKMVPYFEELSYEQAIKSFNRIRSLKYGLNTYTFSDELNCKLLLYQTESSAVSTEDLSWLGDNLVLKTIGGDHHSIMKEPHVETLAEYISSDL